MFLSLGLGLYLMAMSIYGLVSGLSVRAVHPPGPGGQGYVAPGARTTRRCGDARVLVAAAQPVLDVPEFAAVFLFVFFILWCFVDNFRRRDHHGAAKAIWTVVILFIPVIGSIVYIAARPADAQLTA